MEKTITVAKAQGRLDGAEVAQTVVDHLAEMNAVEDAPDRYMFSSRGCIPKEGVRFARA